MSRPQTLRLIISILLLCALFLPFSIQAGSLPSLRVAASAPTTLDPQLAIAPVDIAHLRLLYEGLTRFDRGLAVTAGAAVGWIWNTAHTQVTYTLRQGLSYSDGAPLNAMRYEYALLRALSPFLASPSGALLMDVQGAAAYHNADIKIRTTEEIAGLRAAVQIRALDTTGQDCTSYAQTNCLNLRILLTRPVYDFDARMAQPIAFPAREDLIQPDPTGWWEDIANLASNGPFLLTALNTYGRTDFFPNSTYWRGEPGYTLRFYYVGVPAFALDAYRQGKVDIISPALEDLPVIVADPRLKAEIVSYSGACTQMMAFNQAIPPFDDPQIRAAFLYAFDRTSFVSAALGGDGLPTMTWIPPSMIGHRYGENRWNYDPARAIRTIEASSYRNQYKLPKITVTYRRNARDLIAWSWIRRQFKLVLDVEINLVPLSAGQSIDGSALYLINECMTSTDPGVSLNRYWNSDSGWAKRLGFTDPTVDGLLEQAAVEPDLTTRIMRYDQAVDRITTLASAAFINNNRLVFLVKPNVTGLSPTAFDTLWVGELDPLAIHIQPHTFLPWVDKQ